jgi:hypothetical protein
LHQLSPEAIPQSELIEKVQKMLCYHDPSSVMGAMLNVIEPLTRVDVQPFKDLMPYQTTIGFGRVSRSRET